MSLDLLPLNHIEDLPWVLENNPSLARRWVEAGLFSWSTQMTSGQATPMSLFDVVIRAPSLSLDDMQAVLNHPMLDRASPLDDDPDAKQGSTHAFLSRMMTTWSTWMFSKRPDRNVMVAAFSDWLNSFKTPIGTWFQKPVYRFHLLKKWDHQGNASDWLEAFRRLQEHPFGPDINWLDLGKDATSLIGVDQSTVHPLEFAALRHGADAVQTLLAWGVRVPFENDVDDRSQSWNVVGPIPDILKWWQSWLDSPSIGRTQRQKDLGLDLEASFLAIVEAHRAELEEAWVLLAPPNPDSNLKTWPNRLRDQGDVFVPKEHQTPPTVEQMMQRVDPIKRKSWKKDSLRKAMTVVPVFWLLSKLGPNSLKVALEREELSRHQAACTVIGQTTPSVRPRL